MINRSQTTTPLSLQARAWLPKEPEFCKIWRLHDHCPAVFKYFLPAGGLRESVCGVRPWPGKTLCSVKVLVEPGYMKVSGMGKKPADTLPGTAGQDEVFGGDSQNPEGDEDSQENKALLESIKKIKKGDMLDIGRIYIKEGRHPRPNGTIPGP